ICAGAAKSPDGASAPCLLIFNIPNLFFYCTIFGFSARWLFCFHIRRFLWFLSDSGTHSHDRRSVVGV
ncbi:TPA: hypothetical protein ACWLW2_002087, partial [Morganella morganii]